MDAFARQHLHEWWRSGGAPNHWMFSDLVAFEAWVDRNADDLLDMTRYVRPSAAVQSHEIQAPENLENFILSSWSDLAKTFDAERSNA